jgi:hypothetical protein
MPLQLVKKFFRSSQAAKEHIIYCQISYYEEILAEFVSDLHKFKIKLIKIDEDSAALRNRLFSGNSDVFWAVALDTGWTG